MKIIFLDIDGVVNSLRTVMAYGGYPHNLGEDLELFDGVALQMIRNLCEEHDIKIVLSSTWRLHDDLYRDIAEKLKLPIIDRTPCFMYGGGTNRGHEVEAWLKTHPEVKNYVIVDDVDSFFPIQKKHFVKVDGEEGLSFKNICKIKKKLGLKGRIF